MSVQSIDSDGLTVPCNSGVDTTEWRVSDLTGGLLAFFDPCGSCFPDADDDATVDDLGVDRVVRSTNNQAKALHCHPDDLPDDHELRDPDDTRDGELSDPERCERCQRPISLSYMDAPDHKINLPCGCRVPVPVDASSTARADGGDQS